MDTETVDMLPVPDEEQMNALATRLLGFGLKPWEVEVLINKDIMKMSLKDIMRGGAYTSVGAVLRIYGLAKAKAKLAYEEGGSFDA